MFEIIARVFRANESEVGSLVELSNGKTTVSGKISRVSEDEFVVDWSDGARSVENKSDYELIINSKLAAEETDGSTDGKHLSCPVGAGCEVADERFIAEQIADAHARARHVHYCLKTGPNGEVRCAEAAASHASDHASCPVGVGCDVADQRFITSLINDEHEKGRHTTYCMQPGRCETVARSHGMRSGSVTAAENPAQPAGWAVAPVDADAYPGGELIAIEMQKRNDTASWEDSQNRDPIDAENPAQPAGFAVPPATGGPIPGQGASGLSVVARVYADDLNGEEGIVQISDGNTRLSGYVLAADDDSFIVQWEDERRTVEDKNNYELIVEAGIMDTIREKIENFQDDRVLNKAIKRNFENAMTDIEMRKRGLKCDNCGNLMVDKGRAFSQCADCAVSPEAAAQRKVDTEASAFGDRIVSPSEPRK